MRLRSSDIDTPGGGRKVEWPIDSMDAETIVELAASSRPNERLMAAGVLPRIALDNVELGKQVLAWLTYDEDSAVRNAAEVGYWLVQRGDRASRADDGP